MSWDQFIGACLGLALVALGRLLDKYLPSSHDQPAPAALPPTTEPPDVPPVG